jgi:hypothetical protein
MSLSDTKIRSIKPSDKPFKLTDSHGLYLLVNPGGSRLWYLKYRFNRKESRIALGAYPQVSLSDAPSSVMASVNYWRRISIPHNNA